MHRPSNNAANNSVIDTNMPPKKRLQQRATWAGVELPVPETVDRQPSVDGQGGDESFKPLAEISTASLELFSEQHDAANKNACALAAGNEGPPSPPAQPPVDSNTVLSFELEGNWMVTSNGDTEIGTVRVTLNDELTSGTIWFCDATTHAHLRFRMIIDPDPLVTDAANRPLVILDREYVTTKKFWRVSRWGEDGFAWKATVLPVKDEHLGWIREHPSDDLDFVAGILVWTKTLPETAARVGPNGELLLPVVTPTAVVDAGQKKKKKRSTAICYPPKWKRSGNHKMNAVWKDGKSR